MYNFSPSNIQLKKAEKINSKGRNIDTYKGPFLLMHHVTKYNASAELTIP